MCCPYNLGQFNSRRRDFFFICLIVQALSLLFLRRCIHDAGNHDYRDHTDHDPDNDIAVRGYRRFGAVGDVCAVVRSPGMKYKHYAPKADVTLLEGTFEQFKAYVDAHADQNLSCLCFTGEAEKLGWPCVEYGREGDGADQAKHIFRSLRALDEQGDGVVYARCPKKDGLSMAVYNRLIRAAAFRVIQL